MDGWTEGWMNRQTGANLNASWLSSAVHNNALDYHHRSKKNRNRTKTKLIHTSSSSKACWVGYIRIHGDWTIASESSTGATSANYRCSWWTITSKSFPIWGYRNWWQGSIGTRDTGWLLAAGILGVILHVAFSGKILERWASGYKQKWFY